VVTELAEPHQMSLPVISKGLKVLDRANLIPVAAPPSDALATRGRSTQERNHLARALPAVLGPELDTP